MAFERDPNELGCLWEKTGPKGPYMTGEINGVKVIIFRNGRKQNDKQPDWRVLRSVPRAEQPAPRVDEEPPF